MKIIYPLALTLLLPACGGSGGSGDTKPSNNSASSTANTTPSGIVTNKDGKLNITGDNNTATVISDKKAEISISGDRNVIYIQSNVSTLDVVGNSNTFEVSNGVTIDKCMIIGDTNKATKPTDLTITCSIQGKSNSGFN